MSKSLRALGCASLLCSLALTTACEDENAATTAPGASAAKQAGSAAPAASGKAAAAAKEGDTEKKEKVAESGFADGEVFKHMPAECKGGRFYASLGTLLGDSAVAKNLDSLLDNMAGAMGGGDDKAKKVIDELEKGGFDPVKNIKELGACLGDNGKPVVVAFGIDKGKIEDPLGLVAKAAETGGQKPKKEDKDGVTYLSMEGEKGFMAQASDKVILLADTQDDIAKVVKGGDGASGFADAKGKILWASIQMGPEQNVDISLLMSGDNYEGKFAMSMPKAQADLAKKDPDAFTKEMEKERDKAAKELEATPFKAASEHIKNVKISVEGDKMVVSASVPKSALADLTKAAADMKPEELMRGM